MFSIDLWAMVLIVAYCAMRRKMVSVMDPDKYQVDSVLLFLIITHIYYFEGAGMCNVSNSVQIPCVGPPVFVSNILGLCCHSGYNCSHSPHKNIYCPGSYTFLGFGSPLLTLIVRKDTIV